MYMHAVSLKTCGYPSNCYSFVNTIVFVVVDDCWFYSFLYTFVNNNNKEMKNNESVNNTRAETVFML